MSETESPEQQLRRELIGERCRRERAEYDRDLAQERLKSVSEQLAAELIERQRRAAVEPDQVDYRGITGEKFIERLKLMASPEFCNISMDDKQIIWWALRQIRVLEGAVEFARDNGRLADHSHWDRKCNAGRTCPVCIDQRKVANLLRAALAQMETKS